MSGNAAKEISNLLEASIQKVNGIVVETRTQVERLISDGKRTVESGTDVARQCGEMLQEIVHNVSSVSTMAGEIASASSEQSRGVTEISKAMAQLDQTTQQNASASEECASAAEELSAQAEALKGAVSTLVQTIEGKQDGVAAAPAAAALPARQEKKSLAKVVPFKGAKEPAREPLKKVAGGTPSYNHEGFEEV
jgi:methyl-accepting chemotaxis protein